MSVRTRRENVRTFIYYLTYTVPLGITVGLGSLSWIGESDGRQG